MKRVPIAVATLVIFFSWATFTLAKSLETAEKELLAENWSNLEAVCKDWLKNEDSPVAHYLLMIACFSTGQTDKKEEEAKKAADLDSGDLYLWANKLYTKYPGNPLVYHVLGGIESLEGKYESSISHLSEAIKLRPQYYDAYFTRGNVYDKLNKYKETIADFSTVIKAGSKHLLDISYFNRGNAFYRTKEYDNAISDYSQAVKINPKHVGAYNARANCYYFKGNLVEAKKNWKVVYELDPNSTMGKAAKQNLSAIE